ncbi:MAG TPA: STAS domain-containing protein [Burkholderiales bacterium]|nr:STAS domain-containing protein [Burkholderiales bacterium]
MSLTIAVDASQPPFGRLSLAGRLDTTTAPALEKKVDEVLAAKPLAVVFDMAALEYISSAGLRAIFRTQKAMHAANGEVLMVNLQPAVQKVFDIVKALPLKSVFRSVEELDDYLDAMQRKAREENR